MGCIQRFINFLATIIVLVALIAVGAYFLLLNFMEGQLADSLRRRFMLPPSSTVEIDRGSVFDTLAGRVRAIRLRSSEAKLSGIAMRDLDLRTEDVDFDLVSLVLRRGSVLKRVGSAQVKVSITAEALGNAWVEKGRRVGLKEVTLKFIPPDEQAPQGRVEANATVDALGRQWQLKGNGSFEFYGNKELRLNITDFEVVGVQTGKELFQSVFVQLSPRIRLDELQTDLVIDNCQMSSDRLLISAHSSGAIQPASEGAGNDGEVK